LPLLKISVDLLYRRLRALGRKEVEAKQQYFDGAHKAYEDGDGALAHRISKLVSLFDCRIE
jgi:hypothetical protein